MLVTVLLLIACALVAIVSIPLLMRLIPPNPIYGVRTRRTLADPAVWFEVNAFGGLAFLVAAAVTAILLMAFAGTLLRPVWLQLVTLLVAMGGAVAATIYFERRFG